MRDPYEVLGVTPSATDDEIKAAYRTQAKKYHPDLNGGSVQAEAKMKEVNEAYSILIKHKGEGGYQQGSSGYGGSGGYSGYGGFGNTGSYGSGGGSGNGGYGSGGYGGSGNGYGGSNGNGYGGNGQGGGFDFGGFDFENLFGGGARRNYQTSDYNENDPQFKSAESAVLEGRYDDALNLLAGIREHKAAWHYWSARANVGLGNRIAALNDAKAAVNMSPDEPAFRELLAQLNAGSRSYGQRGAQGGYASYCCSNPCLTLCVANMVCNCCCNMGGRRGAC